jgi:hypothetical protein
MKIMLLRRNVILFGLMFIIMPVTAQLDSTWMEIFPVKHTMLLQVKGGYSKNQIKSDKELFWAVGGEYRFKPIYYTDYGGGYIQLTVPVMMYHFTLNNEIIVDIKFRPDLGPPISSWLPLTMMDIGYIYVSGDWFTGNDTPLHSLMLGGWFMIPLIKPDDGIFMVSGSKSISGDAITRFSCYTHWFVTSHLGITIHGDNFVRTLDAKKHHFGSFNLGIIYRL